jgi:hypothetical protein
VSFVGDIIPRTREDSVMSAISAADSCQVNFTTQVSRIKVCCLPAARIVCAWLLEGSWGLVTGLKFCLFCFVLLV